jgi:AcrR family transcriptional regulator
VLDGAERLVREKGFSALSMRRLADVLSITPTALYSHVADRTDLVDAVLDRRLAAVSEPTTGTPRERLGELMHRVRRALLENPELSPHYLSRRTIGPEALRIGGNCTRLLIAAGVDPALALNAMKALMVFTIGAATIDLPAAAGPISETAARRDSEATFSIGLGVFLRGLD